MPATQRTSKPKAAKGGSRARQTNARFESAKLEKFFEVLDAVGWLDLPTVSQVAQFAGVDPRTAGKLLKNGMLVGLIECLPAQQYRLIRPYPHKGNDAQKRAVVQDSLVRLPLLVSLRQFLRLGASISDALRKAAAVQRISSYDPAAFTPLLNWAQSLGALNPDVDAEELVIQAEEAKEIRHQVDATKRVVFLSHSSKDKAFIRRLATDLLSEGITVWIDEQDIKVGDSIPERIAQGVADSDFFLVALSINSIESDWVKKELNSALVDEIIRRKTKVLPVLLSKVEIPASIKDKKYADFSDNYKEGLRELLRAIKERG